MIRGIVLGLLFFCTAIQAEEIYPFANNAERDRFQQLTQQFRCMVCQNEDLASSNAALAKDLRDEIYRLVAQGQDDKSIVDYMVKRYGDYVLFRPPWQYQTYVLWLGPFFLVFMGLCIMIRIMRRAGLARKSENANT